MEQPGPTPRGKKALVDVGRDSDPLAAPGGAQQKLIRNSSSCHLTSETVDYPTGNQSKEIRARDIIAYCRWPAIQSQGQTTNGGAA